MAQSKEATVLKDAAWHVGKKGVRLAWVDKGWLLWAGPNEEWHLQFIQTF
jgi:hypothetical protein